MYKSLEWHPTIWHYSGTFGWQDMVCDVDFYYIYKDIISFLLHNFSINIGSNKCIIMQLFLCICFLNLS